MALDTVVQARIELDTLATLAQWQLQHGNVAALRSLSALVRVTLESAVQEALEQGAQVVPAHAAQVVLQSMGLKPKVRAKALLHNMQREDARESGTATTHAKSVAKLTIADLEDGVASSERDAGEFDPSALRARKE